MSAVVLGLALLGATAVAAPSPPPGTLPGRRLALPRCTEDPAASCWELAPELRRFVPGHGLPTPPVSAKLRLAWDDSGLLLRIDELPSADGSALGDGAAQVELALGDPKRTGRISRAAAVRSSSPGVLRLAQPLQLGEARDLWINLVVRPETGGRAALPWSPAGELQPWRPAEVVLVESPDLQLALSLERGDESWRVEAIGADRITVRHEREDVPWGSRGMPAPWQAEGADLLETAPPPDTGWYTLELQWSDAQGVPVDATAVRFWHEAAAPSPPLIWPPPRELRHGTDIALDWAEGGRVCGPEGPARLLAEELTRFTGAPSTVAPAAGPDCDVQLSIDAALGEEAFTIAVEDGRAQVTGGDLLGLSYGSLALADAVGPDGTAPTLQVADAPDILERPLFHSIQVGNRPDLTLEDYHRWVRRVVLRGRYDALHIMLSDGLAWETDPALASPRAWTKAELEALDTALAELGMELVPGINAPGHTAWLLRHRPELTEDVNRNLLDTRHPDARPLLDALWQEAWEAFGSPAALHIGHDEAIWQSPRWFGDERNPRTAASPRWFVLADDLRWHLNWCRARGLTPYLWSDLLLAGWNGAKDGGHKALDELTEAERAEMVVMAWSPLGDPLDALVAERGMRVMRVHTGYLEWKRAGLEQVQDQLAGEGLGLFQPAPWAAFGPATGTRPLFYHLGATLLAGATGWRTALVHTHIEPTIGALVGHPAARPGFEGAQTGRARALRVTGAAPGEEQPAVSWPSHVKTDELRIPIQPAVATAGSPVELRPRRGTGERLVLLHATELAHDAENLLRHDLRRPGKDTAAWSLEVEWEDGRTERLPVVYGIDTYDMVGDPRGSLQWTVADTVPLASPAALATDPSARDRRLYRSDWTNPRPGVGIVAWRVVVERPGVAVVVGGGVHQPEHSAPGEAP